MRSGFRRRQARPRCEEAGERSRELWRIGKHGLGLRPALEMKRRRPGSDVDVGVSDVRVVPVEEDRATLRKTEVVAADVKVEQRVAFEDSAFSGVAQNGQVLPQPAP